MRNIIITGGGMVNKGAQAMTFAAVDQLKRRFPTHRIYLLSEADRVRPREEREQYGFSFMGWYPTKFAKCQKNPLLRLLCRVRSGAELAQAEEIYRNTDLMVDISGYALGSNWSDKICNDFLDYLEFAKGFGFPIYLMPQSFGPFDYQTPGGAAVHARTRELLPYAKKIFAREQESYDALVNTYGLKNVQLANDLVLCSREVDLKNVFQRQPKLEVPALRENPVGIIPNMRNAQVGEGFNLEQLYDELIRHLLETNHTVYLLSHSTMDAEICQGLKARFADEERVILLDRDFSCLEFNELVKGFRFLIASRFHSIVHAYKNGIPCIAVGWATKYRELLKLFGQQQYLFDVRADFRTASLLDAVSMMESRREQEADLIRGSLSELQKKNVFEELSL